MNRPYVDSIESVSAIFETIYRSDTWTLGSGPGSLPTANAPLIEFLQKFIQKNRIARFVDFGCGDWQFMSAVDLGNVNYLGLDCRSVLVENRSRHQRSNVSFARTPDDLADLPEGDLILFKDVLVHLPNAYIAEALHQAWRKFRFIITVNNCTTDSNGYNSEIQCGGFRPVDIARPPFSLPCETVLQYAIFARAGSTVALDSCGDLPSFCLAGLKARPNGYGERA